MIKFEGNEATSEVSSKQDGRSGAGEEGEVLPGGSQLSGCNTERQD